MDHIRPLTDIKVTDLAVGLRSGPALPRPAGHRRWPLSVFRLEFWSMTTVPLSEAKARLSEIADEVDRTHDRVQITRNGRDYVVLISAEDLESMEATIELLSDPAAIARVQDADAALARGETTSADEMSRLMADRQARERDR
jgi:antitoxin YefM